MSLKTVSFSDKNLNVHELQVLLIGVVTSKGTKLLLLHAIRFHQWIVSSPTTPVSIKYVKLYLIVHIVSSHLHLL